MSEKGSLEVKDILGKFSNTFKNLLKEFPKAATDDFIYDGSTITKIGKASTALAELSSLLGQETVAVEDLEKLKTSHTILSQLMVELPKSPADDFAYDRAIHQLVEDARQTLVELEDMNS